MLLRPSTYIIVKCNKVRRINRYIYMYVSYLQIVPENGLLVVNGMVNIFLGTYVVITHYQYQINRRKNIINCRVDKYYSRQTHIPN